MATRYTPGTTKDINLFVSGLGLLGLIKSLQLPEVKTKKEVINSQHVDTGILEPMEFEVDVASLNETMYAEVAKLEKASFKAKGSMLENNKSKSFVATMSGPLDLSTESIEPGKAVGQKAKMYVNAYHLEIDGVEILDIDIPNYIAKINGVDIYESIRSALT